MSRILVVEDEPAIRDAVAYALRADGFDVDVVGDGEEALVRLEPDSHDIAIFDVMLPGISGTELCRRVRAESPIPIIMLTAKDAEVDRVLGLELGADDYVTKPFSMPELVGRVRAQLRRRALDTEHAAQLRRVGALELDLVRHEVRIAGQTVQLTPSEFRLLELLSAEPERVFSRSEIVAHLWSSEHVGDERGADTHVVNLRRKIEAVPTAPTRLVTVRGVGYKLVGV